MQPVTFTCLHCNNLMAVGPEHLGQQVRCPTCGQIVQAPAPTPPAYVLEPAPVQPPGVMAPDEVPEFDIQAPAEAPESIFGEDHGEEIFGAPPPKVELPPEMIAPVASTNGSNQTGFAPYPPPDALATPMADPQFTSEIPASAFEIAPQAPTEEMPVVSIEPPASVEQPHWTAPVEAPASADPPPMFVDSPAAAEMSGAMMEPAAEVTQRRQQSPERKKQSWTAVTFLAPYALLATVLAGWFGYQYYDLRAKHPLENIPDIIGDNEPAKRNPHKQTSERTVRMPSPDQSLPDKLKVSLGGVLQIGDLEVKPLRIEEDKFQFTTIYDSGATETRTSPNAALILHVRLKNTSSEVVFHPTDPFFDRQYIADQHRSKPYVFLEVGEQRFYGGPFNYLGFRRDAKNPRKRVYATGQENDDKPLLPGEERETCFYTFPDSEGRLLSAVHGFKDTVVWRLQLRRGLISFKDREYSMCAVVGVQFTAADIHKAN